MFTLDKNISYQNIESPKVQDTTVNGLKYSVRPITYIGDKSGCALIAQYLGTMFNKLGYFARMDMDQINAVYNEALTLDEQKGRYSEMFPTMMSAMQACLNLGYIINADLVAFNDIPTLKWYMHEYKNVVVQLKLTDTTKNAHGFTIDSSGTPLFKNTCSKGFILMQYDENSLILQNSIGENCGARGFNKINWDTFRELFIDGAVFKI